jgi:hypothetical protein
MKYFPEPDTVSGKMIFESERLPEAESESDSVTVGGCLSFLTFYHMSGTGI